ncbi:class I SAM-dependent methyltransferase [Marinibaculum pumilum]|uniref:Class I SAM-dependent methyltransferase n=1 Tax=Marinibaculum pumilum TaxID=1766165 RepID=A0ABV7L0H8_9PROT
MEPQLQHSALPTADHDEAARQAFVQSLKLHLATKVVAGNREIYETRVKPDFARRHGRPPADRREVATLMRDEPYYQLWGSMQRCSQEMMHDAVLGPVSRQRDALAAKMSPPANPAGSLTLDDNVAAPPYLTAVDIHCMPGGYMGDLAGPLYDRIVHIYAMAGWGPDNGAMGRTVTDYIRQAHPELKPARILDMGCGIGNSTLPYADAFPEAELQAIDVSAPQLRYAHARAEALGKTVHFRQADATATPYPDASFDLIVSHILLHETSAKAIRQLMAEGHRLLRPGGLMLHVDLALYDGMDPFDAFMLDWDTHHNNEPFWGTFRDMDAGALLTEAGFAAEDLVSALVSRTGNAAHVFSDKRDSGGRRYWQIVGAAKRAA